MPLYVPTRSTDGVWDVEARLLAVMNVSSAVVITRGRSVRRMEGSSEGGVLRSFGDLRPVSFPRRRAPPATSDFTVLEGSSRGLKLDDEARAGTTGLLVQERAAEGFDQRPRDREAEARALLCLRIEGTGERLEQVRP